MKNIGVNKYYISTIFIFLAYCLAVDFEWLMAGDMISENSVLYYKDARSNNLLKKLLGLDAGYIPILPRLLSIIYYEIGARTTLTPYLYNFSAIIFAAVIVGIINIKYFRRVIEDDKLRFIFGLLALIIGGFELRLFFNFPYFIILPFMLFVISAFSLKKDDEISPLIYLLPLLIFSKPFIFTILPAMFFSLFFCKNQRVRIVFILCLFAAFIQITTLYLSSQLGILAKFNKIDMPITYKFQGSFLIFFGLIFYYVCGPFLGNLMSQFSPLLTCIFGIFFLIYLSALLKKSKRVIIIYCALSFIFFNSLLNNFAISATWNIYLYVLAYAPFNRHSSVAVWSGVLIVICILEVLTKQNIRIKFIEFNKKHLPILFLAWIILFGFSEQIIKKSKPRTFPLIGSYYWQKNSELIDSGKAACIPGNSYKFYWMYKKDCFVINNYIEYDDKRKQFKAKTKHKVAINFKGNHQIIGFDGLIFTKGKKYQNIKYQVNIDGKEFSGKVETNKKGRLFFHNEGLTKTPLKNINKVNIVLNEDAYLPVNENGEIIFNWYGIK